jgi:hypothetical protein
MNINSFKRPTFGVNNHGTSGLNSSSDRMNLLKPVSSLLQQIFQYIMSELWKQADVLGVVDNTTKSSSVGMMYFALAASLYSGVDVIHSLSRENGRQIAVLHNCLSYENERKANIGSGAAVT